LENSKAQDADDAGPDVEYPLPPATFEFLVLRLATEAQMFLGLLHFGEEKDAPKPNLKAAQHAIDLLAMLLEKTRGNLSLDEKRLLENHLTELRFRYVQVAEAQAKVDA
jgi:Domain of unknown function (DUF1844)